MKRLFGIICALVAVRSGADTLFDMKAAVSRLTAKQPVRATYASEQRIKAAGRFSNEDTARRIVAEVVHDEHGISITIPQSLLDQASQEARNSGRDSTAQRAINSLRSDLVVDALDFHASLLDLLQGASVTEEKRVSLHNKTARLLIVKLTRRSDQRAGAIESGSAKSDERLNLWIGDDNLPLAAERFQTTTVGFMIFHGTNTNRTTYTFAHTNDRLILARVETSGSSEGMGQKVEDSSIQTLTLH